MHAVNIIQLKNSLNQVKVKYMQHWADLAPQKPTAVAVLLLNIPAIAVVPAKWLPLFILFSPFFEGVIAAKLIKNSLCSV